MRLVIIVLITAFISSTAFAATQIVDEDFEDVTSECFLIDNSTISFATNTNTGDLQFARVFHDQCVGDCDSCGYDSYPSLFDGDRPRIVTGSECQDNGTCIRGYINGSEINGYPYEEPKILVDNLIGGSKKVYVKFDLKIASNLGTSNATREASNVKLLRITSYTSAGSSSNDHWHPQLNLEPDDSSSYWSYWECYDDCTNSFSQYDFNDFSTDVANSMMDNDWHTYEIYIDIGSQVPSGTPRVSTDGIYRLWEDGVLIEEATNVPWRTVDDTANQEINSIAIFRHWKELNAPVTPAQGNLYIDNIEVWDGMPDAEADPTSVFSGQGIFFGGN